MKNLKPIILLGLAQFVMVLDSTVMNVSISTVVADLHTTVQKMQLAIASYTLVMAAFMLAGAALGNRWGRRKALVIGLCIYGCGSLTTSLAPNFAVLYLGWSVLEGLGAVLVVPAIAALAAANYTGRERALAYGILGGVAGAAAATGPIIGGWFTSTLSWRYVFAGEVIIVILVLIGHRVLSEGERPKATKGFDVVGVVLSAVGLGMVVIALVQSSTWGWIRPRTAAPFTVAGFAPTIPLVAAGALVTYLFIGWQRRLVAHKKAFLLDPALLDVPPLRAGLSTLAVQQFIIAGAFFVLPLYLQVVLGKDALQSGIRILPLSIGLFVFSLAGAVLSGRFPARRIVRVGLVVTAVGVGWVLASIDTELVSVPFACAMFVFGAGIGLIASQLGNVNLSAVDVSRGSEVGGLQGTAQNLGASLGTAIVGAILITGLSAGFATGVAKNPDVSAEVAQRVKVASTDNAGFLPAADVTAAAQKAGLPSNEVTAITHSYEAAQIGALKAAMGLVALVGLGGLFFTHQLPGEVVSDPTSGPDDGTEPGPEADPDLAPAPEPEPADP